MPVPRAGSAVTAVVSDCTRGRCAHRLPVGEEIARLVGQVLFAGGSCARDRGPEAATRCRPRRRPRASAEKRTRWTAHGLIHSGEAHPGGAESEQLDPQLAPIERRVSRVDAHPEAVVGGALEAVGSKSGLESSGKPDRISEQQEAAERGAQHAHLERDRECHAAPSAAADPPR